MAAAMVPQPGIDWFFMAYVVGLIACKGGDSESREVRRRGRIGYRQGHSGGVIASRHRPLQGGDLDEGHGAKTPLKRIKDSYFMIYCKR